MKHLITITDRNGNTALILGNITRFEQEPSVLHYTQVDPMGKPYTDHALLLEGDTLTSEADE